MPQQEIGHAGVKCLCADGHGVEIVQNGAVAVRLSKIAVVSFRADGAAVAEVVVSGDKNAPAGKIFGQGLVAVDKFHHAVGKLQDGAHIALRHTAERMQRPPRDGGRNGEIDHLAHGGDSFFSYSAPILRRQAGQMQ